MDLFTVNILRYLQDFFSTLIKSSSQVLEVYTLMTKKTGSMQRKHYTVKLFSTKPKPDRIKSSV